MEFNKVDFDIMLEDIFYECKSKEELEETIEKLNKSISQMAEIRLSFIDKGVVSC